MRKENKYRRFNLILMVTHACNLRCRYCYAGKPSDRNMDLRVALKAVECAVASTAKGGELELGFFGGEPLLEAKFILLIIDYAADLCANAGIALNCFFTTNGTINNSTAWKLMLDKRVRVSVSYDGVPFIHDKNRCDFRGQGTAERVLATIQELIKYKRLFSIISVVTPNNIEFMPQNIRFFIKQGIKYAELNLDLWSKWSLADLDKLKDAITSTVQVWKNALPDIGVNWFDEKLLKLAGLCNQDQCRFGNGEVAVAPSGAIYPCERLIGEDAVDNPKRIADDIFSLHDFLESYKVPVERYPACEECGMKALCSTHCRCSNYVRTGNVALPDKLLCVKEKTCIEEVAKVAEELTMKKEA